MFTEPGRKTLYQSIHDTHELRKGSMYSSLKDQYEKLPDTHPLKPYLKYFATNAAESSETRKIHTKVEWYRSDEKTQERYMTWEQEIQLAAEAAAEKERERNEKIIAEKDAEISEKNAELAALRAEIERLKSEK